MKILVDGEIKELKILENEIVSKYQPVWDSMGDEYDPDTCKRICEAAGLADEWEQADGENFENVLEKACEILGIEA